MPANLGGWTGLILILVVILLFAAPKLPVLARNLGQSMTIFKKEVRTKDGEESAEAPVTSVAPADAAPVAHDTEAPAASTPR
jgi:sec-independent protein translocase protein TatA